MNAIVELNYLSTIVFHVYEKVGADAADPSDRFRVTLALSPGVDQDPFETTDTSVLAPVNLITLNDNLPLGHLERFLQCALSSGTCIGWGRLFEPVGGPAHAGRPKTLRVCDGRRGGPDGDAARGRRHAVQPALGAVHAPDRPRKLIADTCTAVFFSFLYIPACPEADQPMDTRPNARGSSDQGPQGRFPKDRSPLQCPVRQPGR